MFYLPIHTKLTWVAGGETINILSLAICSCFTYFSSSCLRAVNVVQQKFKSVISVWLRKKSLKLPLLHFLVSKLLTETESVFFKDKRNKYWYKYRNKTVIEHSFHRNWEIFFSMNIISLAENKT